MMKNTESYELVGGNKCEELLKKYPDYKIFWRSGFAYRGASEREDDKEERMEYAPGGMRKMSFEERMQRRYDWSAAIDIDVDHVKREIHMNGFSENDMY